MDKCLLTNLRYLGDSGGLQLMLADKSNRYGSERVIGAYRMLRGVPFAYRAT